MSNRNYWLDLFTGTTWQEFLDAGASVSGFRENRWKTVQQVDISDYLLCYITGISRFIGVLEVASAAYQDKTPIWKQDAFPCRVRVKPVVTLSPETAVSILELRERLSIFQNLSSPFAWTGHLRGSPRKWKVSDGEVIVDAIFEAQRNPNFHPVDAAKLARRPLALKAAKIGPVTVPENDETIEVATQVPKEPTLHTEMQWLLLKLGNDMGLDVWVARNDYNRSFQGHPFISLPRFKTKLPLQFDEATTKTVELIDVLWLKGNAIIAAFEIECTTSIYSGLLRMADLITMQPNLNIPLYLVAPDDRRNKVINEVNRPTFSHLTPPMNQMCRFISIPTLRERITQYASVVKFLKPEFLEELSESCEPEEI